MILLYLSGLRRDVAYIAYYVGLTYAVSCTESITQSHMHDTTK